MARDFTGGADNDLTHADNAVLSITGNILLACWVRRTSIAAVTDNEMAVGKWESTGNQRSYWLGVSSAGDGIVRMLISDDGTFQGGGDVSTPANTMRANTWHWIVGWQDVAGSQVIEVDGVQEVSGGGLLQVHDNNEIFGIGGGDDAADNFDGAIAHVYVIPEILTAPERFELRKKSIWKKKWRQGGHWPIIGVRSPEPDLSNHRNHMTVNNAPAFFPHPPEVELPRLEVPLVKAAAAAAAIFPDSWHPGIQQPYPHTKQVVPYQKS